MKVAYVAIYNSKDIRYWSGLGYYIAQCLEKQGIELIRIDCSVKFSLFQRIMRRLTRVFHHRIRQIEREPAYLRRVADRINERLAGQEYDIVFSPGSLPISYLRTTKPIVFFSDATYDCMARQYEGQNALSRNSIMQGHRAEASAIHNASLIFYTSEWASRSAITVYSANPDKIMPLGFGPNLPVHIPEGRIEKMLNERKERTVKTFLFMGIDWQRKGAGLAIEVIRQLNERGINSHVILVGCQVPPGVILPPFVTHYPFVSKSTPVGIAFLQQLFEKADFFILPTQADYTPIVFSEAASFGLPIITTDVGGCRSVVLNGVTGFCLPRDHFVEEAVRKITWLCANEEVYESFCLDAFYHYKRTLNWEVTGRKAVAAMRQLISSRPLSDLSLS